MTLRTRILIACLVAALLPLALLAVGVRRQVNARLGAEFEARVAASARVLRQDIEAHAQAIDARLDAIARAVADDAADRAALLQQGSDPLRRIDIAPTAMRTAALDYLILADAEDVVLSAGHFSQDFGRRSAVAAALLRADVLPLAGTTALVQARRADGSFLVLARARHATIGGQRFAFVGGIEVDSAFVRSAARDDGALVVALDFPGGALISHAERTDASAWGGLTEQIAMPFVDDTGDHAGGQAVWTITHSLLPLRAMQRAMDRWLLAAAGGAVLLALIVSRLLAARLSRPLEELADRTTRVAIERMDVRFATRRRDEIGTLSRMLDAMVQRLREGAARLREAERRATVGDMARQVNHDIRNGLLPIRNVVQHLGEVAAQQPSELATVFGERQQTLSGGIAYLENLATSYARLSPRGQDAICDVNAIARDVARDVVLPQHVRVDVELDRQSLRVAADPVALRRVLENLLINAVESLDGSAGIVTLTTQSNDGEVVLTVADTGPGMSVEELDRIFTDFYTTKPHGTGLGLSIVRRITADLGGRVSVDSRPGTGTVFRIQLPAVP